MNRVFTVSSATGAGRCWRNSGENAAGHRREHRVIDTRFAAETVSQRDDFVSRKTLAGDIIAPTEGVGLGGKC